MREEIIEFLRQNLMLKIKSKNDIIVKTKWGLKFLGVQIFPKGMRLNKKNWQKINIRLNHKNISSYSGLIKKYDKKKLQYFNWQVMKKIED